MVSTSQVILAIIISWLILITIASRYNLQRFNLFVSSGFLIWKSERFSQIITKWGKAKFWGKYTKFSSLPILILFFLMPIVLLINLFLSFFNRSATILPENPFSNLRIEIFLLLIPALFIVVSFYAIIKGILSSHFGQKISVTGILVVVAVVTFFVRIPSLPQQNKKQLQVLTGSIMSCFVIFLLLLPVSFGMPFVVDSLYKDSSAAIVLSVTPDSPAQLGGVYPNDIIYGLEVAVNNAVVAQTTILSATDYYAQLRQIPPGISITVITERGPIPLESVEPPDDRASFGSYLGIEAYDYTLGKFNFLPVLLPLWTDIFFRWAITLAMMFGLYQILPIPKSDGNQILEIVLSTWKVSLSKRVKQVISLFSVALLAANVLVT